MKAVAGSTWGDAAKLASRHLEHEPGPDLVRPRVLVVDDHPSNLVALEAVLEPLNLELVMCSSGEDALRQLLNSDFALILLDVQMPGLDGFKTAQLIKERPKSQDVPIIFITALSRDTNHVFRGYANGAVDYLLKPFDPDILRSKVAVFVQLFRQREMIRFQEAELRARERAEEERKAEERIRALVDAMPLCVWAADADGKPYYCNQIWKSYSGLSAEQSVHFGLDAVHPEDADPLRRAIDEAFRCGQELEIEVRFLRVSDGHYRWHLLRAVPEKAHGKSLLGWIATATDIEQRKRDEEARNRLLAQEQQAREEAQAANRMKDEFLATVSHELRTPLTAILGWIRIMRSGKLDPVKFARATDVIERNGRAQAAIIDDILDVSRIITGKLRLELDAIDIAALVQAALDSIRPAAEAKEISVDWISELPERRVSGDPDRLQQVVWNLLSNAIKFTPCGGKVQVRSRQVASRVEICVSDSGQGIEPEFLPHVFDRFRQADGTSTRRHGGLGLGLAIVRHLVELHGGTVQAESAGAGKGATFTVSLPVRAVQPAPVIERSSLLTRPPGDIGQPSLAGLSVLVVDDEADARELIATVLEQAGARAITAASVDEALVRVVRDRPDVLLTDIGMPGADGYTLLQKIRELAPEQGGSIPAAALTAYSRIEDARRAFAAGFLRHVAKPVEPAFLVAQVAALAGRHRATT
jgi:PAS domain S-box-containing protein